jgi:hypothetical protein
LDFEQLEAFIQNNAVVHSPTQSSQTVVENAQISAATAATNLPESPPDSGSEPPYSPNIKVNQSLQIDHMQQGGNLSNLSTLTELHVPHHHHHHHHNLLTPSNDLYLANEHHQQQLLQINNILHKHDTILSSHHPPPPPPPPSSSQDHQMLLYQVNQNGQIMELNHHIQQSQQTMSGRLYKSDILELESTSAMHDIQQTLQGTLTSDNLPIIAIGAGDSSSYQPQQQQQQHLTSHGMTNGSIGHVKKRKNSANNFSGEMKAYVKSNESLVGNLFNVLIFAFLSLSLSLESSKNYHGVKSKKKQQQQQQQIQIAQDSCTSDQQNEILVDSKKHLQIQQQQQEAKTLSEQYQENNNENKSNNSVFSDNLISKGNESGSDGSQIQCIRFSSFQQQQWHTLLDHNHQEL